MTLTSEDRRTVLFGFPVVMNSSALSVRSGSGVRKLTAKAGHDLLPQMPRCVAKSNGQSSPKSPGHTKSVPLAQHARFGTKADIYVLAGGTPATLSARRKLTADWHRCGHARIRSISEMAFNATGRIPGGKKGRCSITGAASAVSGKQNATVRAASAVCSAGACSTSGACSAGACCVPETPELFRLFLFMLPFSFPSTSPHVQPLHAVAFPPSLYVGP
jgi:hypothetical protein